MTHHLTKDRASSRRRYYRLLKEGLCCTCGQCPPLPEGKRCEPCRDKNRKASRDHARKQRAAWTKLGICVCCGQRQAMHGRSQCGACADARDELHELKKMAA